MFLWKAVNAPVHLVGSMHRLDREWSLPENFSNVIAASHRFVFEHEFLAREDDQKFLPSGRRLSLMVSEKLYRDVATRWSEKKRRFDLERLKLWAVSEELASDDINAFGLTFEGVDSIVRRHAVEAGKVIEYLETLRSVRALQDSVPLNLQREDLRITATRPDVGRDFLAATIAAWWHADLVALSSACSKLCALTPGFAMLLGPRNRRWMPKILSMARSDVPTVIVVGVFHFIGPDDLLSLAERDGLVFQKIAM